jgi:hypothetical protein
MIESAELRVMSEVVVLLMEVVVFPVEWMKIEMVNRVGML